MRKETVINNILVISLQGIGDLLLTTPLLRELKSNFPKAKLSVLTFQSNKDILINNPDVDSIITFNFNDQSNIFKIFFLLFYLRKKRFDLSICTYPSALRSAFIGYLSGAKKRLGQDLNLYRNYRWLFTGRTPIKEVKHAVLMNLDFLKLLGVYRDDLNTQLVLNLNDEDKKFALEFLQVKEIKNEDLIVAIHAGGGKYTVTYRSWPLERFAKLADSLVEKFNAKIIFIGGKNDENTARRVIQMMKQKAITVAGKASLKQTAALIKKSNLLICNNSAPMHIAAALNTPTISFFGPVDLRIHKPQGKIHIAITKELECHPCYYPFFRDTLYETKVKNRWVGKYLKCDRNYECLKGVTVEEVLQLVREILENKNEGK